MCKCHKRSDWTVLFRIDVDGEAQGYDGDSPLQSDRNWRCYMIYIVRECTRCLGQTVHDSLGACWASDDSDGAAYLREKLAEYGMLPRGIALGDCEVCYEQ